MCTHDCWIYNDRGGCEEVSGFRGEWLRIRSFPSPAPYVDQLERTREGRRKNPAHGAPGTSDRETRQSAHVAMGAGGSKSPAIGLASLGHWIPPAWSMTSLCSPGTRCGHYSKTRYATRATPLRVGMYNRTRKNPVSVGALRSITRGMSSLQTPWPQHLTGPVL